MTDEERYQELLDLLSRGLIRYAEKRGLLKQSAAGFGKAEAPLLVGKEGMDND